MSIARRFAISVAANAIRAGLGLLTGLVVARGLGPADYGSLAFLLGSFWAIRALLDAGSSSAFFTFISRRNRFRRVFLAYFAWLAIQFGLSLVLVAAVLPDALVTRFWLGQERFLILLALLAAFLQNQVWQTVVQVHEAYRLTGRAQALGIVVVVAHLCVVLALLAGDWLSVGTVLGAIVAEYLLAAMWAVRGLRSIVGSGSGDGAQSWNEVLREYVHYCRPMVVLGVAGFLGEMTDRWLLQRYGGAAEQGFYQVASQLSTVSLLATSSILNILWKELAEAAERGFRDRVAGLYSQSLRMLVALSVAISSLIAPWSRELVELLLGSAYASAWPVFVVMIFYPVYQAMGQVNGTLFMATGKTSTYMRISIMALFAGMPVNWLLVGPATGTPAGAVGLALKIVGMNIVFVNLQSVVIARGHGARVAWRGQLVAIPLLLATGWAARSIASSALGVAAGGAHGVVAAPMLLAAMAVGATVYAGALALIFLRAPALLGLEPQDVVRIGTVLRQLAARLRRAPP